jgi:hypothetical protein
MKTISENMIDHDVAEHAAETGDGEFVELVYGKETREKINSAY